MSTLPASSGRWCWDCRRWSPAEARSHPLRPAWTCVVVAAVDWSHDGTSETADRTHPGSCEAGRTAGVSRRFSTDGSARSHDAGGRTGQRTDFDEVDNQSSWHHHHCPQCHPAPHLVYIHKRINICSPQGWIFAITMAKSFQDSGKNGKNR